MEKQHSINIWAIVQLLFLSILPPASGSQDNRCFLEGGGAAETFFIKESLRVGRLLGTLRVIGTVGEDIELKIKDNDTKVPLDVEEGTKNLVLTKPLDKEGQKGPDSVNVDILCKRIGSKDPSFPIPVTIRVTDVNDNAPQFIGAPYSLNISELTLVGARIFNGILAVDADQPGPFSTVEYSIAAGRSSDYVTFENPLEGSLVLAKHLDYESLKSFQIKIVARDQGSPPNENETLLTINVMDADDQNPAFFYDHYDAILPDTKTEGQKLIVKPQDVRAFDKDRGLGAPVFYSFNTNANEYKYFELNRNTGHIYIKANIPDNEFLQPVTLVIKATQFDNPDRYAVTTLSVSKGGIFDNDLKFLQKLYNVQILENVPLNSVITTLITNRPSDKRVHFQVEEKSLPGKEFSVNERGDVILRKVLDYEKRENYRFVTHASDGNKNDSARINVTLININDWDPRFKYPEYEFFIAAANMFKGYLVGKIDVHDGDKGDNISLDIKGSHARAFRIDNRGELRIDDTRFLNGTEYHIVIVAEDSGIPPRRASVPVMIRLEKEVSARFQFFPLDNSFMVLIFTVTSIVFFFIIIVLAIYICKNKRKRQSSSLRIEPRNLKRMNTSSPVSPNEYQRGQPMMPTNANFVVHRIRPGSSSSRFSSEETLNSNLALNPLNPRSGSQRYSKNGMIRMTANAKVSPYNGPSPGPPPPTPSIHSNGLPHSRVLSVSEDPMPNGVKLYSDYKDLPNGSMNNRQGSVNSVNSSARSDSDISLNQVLRENIATNSNRDLSRLNWPRNSIPRRVKKLSWEDEFGTTSRDRDISTLMTDPNVSVTPLESANATPEPLIGRAIYF